MSIFEEYQNVYTLCEDVVSTVLYIIYEISLKNLGKNEETNDKFER